MPLAKEPRKITKFIKVLHEGSRYKSAGTDTHDRDTHTHMAHTHMPYTHTHILYTYTRTRTELQIHTSNVIDSEI